MVAAMRANPQILFELHGQQNLLTGQAWEEWLRSFGCFAQEA